jgi:hypothetical protein
VINGFHFLVAVVVVFGFVVVWPWARRRDAEDALAEFHLMHGPASGCVECEDK